MLFFGFWSCSENAEEPVPVIDCNVAGPVLTVSELDVPCGATDGGSIEVQIEGGVAPFNIIIEPDTGELNGFTYNELPEGDYTIITTDANNCQAQLITSIIRQSVGLSYAQDIKPIIETNCTLSGCHNGDNDGAYGQNRNWLVFINVQNNASNIKNRINRDSSVVGHMPKTGSLTKAEIAMISCWVDEGALDN